MTATYAIAYPHVPQDAWDKPELEEVENPIDDVKIEKVPDPYPYPDRYWQV